MTDREIEKIAEQFVRIENLNPETCVHKILHYQQTGVGLKCNECSHTKCGFNTNRTHGKE